MLDSKCRAPFQGGFDSLAKVLLKIKLSPNQITVAALLTGCFSGFIIAHGYLMLGLVALLLSGLFDVLDGSMARLSGKSSNTGAYMDLIFDRMVEAAFIIGYFLYMPHIALSSLFFFAGAMLNFSSFMLAGSLMKNTGQKSIHYDVGLVERTEAFICFTLMLVFHEYAVLILTVFNILMFYTGMERMIRIIKIEKAVGQ